MAKKKVRQAAEKKKEIRLKENRIRKKGPSRFALPDEIKQLIWAIGLFLAAIIVGLSFFGLAGKGGELFMKTAVFILGKAAFGLPLFLILGGLALFGKKYQNRWPVALALFLLIFGVTGTLEVINHATRMGGWLGYLVAWPLLKIFGIIATQVILAGFAVIGLAILWQFLYRPREEQDEVEIRTQEAGEPLIKKIFGPKFKVQPVEATQTNYGGEAVAVQDQKEQKEREPQLDLRPKPATGLAGSAYHFPPLDLLENDKGVPTTGDIRINSAIIKRTLQNFDIQVEMSEINIGPTVTQYTLKPAEGVKLTKITSLSNDLSLALAAHPIRIEAPIPGRPLVGIEVPNKSRTAVRLRNLMEHQNFQNASSTLTLALGRDVAGSATFADLAKMPHLLVAGATGTGKTICLNTIIMSLLYQNSPETLRLIMIDPKRVEFPIYNDIPHLLTPVIFDAQRSVNAFKWLIGEMERRFEVLSAVKARDLGSYNEIMAKEGSELLPYIVLVVDELADLMVSRGRDIEAAVVRLAQMARAVGIHLVLATQRPSVEVITGLIKANITSRITFQVASQVDSRTILDAAGAEKLLGAGDMLFLSAEISKPKRAQAAYASDKEVKKVIKFIKTENPPADEPVSEKETLPDITDSLEKTLEVGADGFTMGGDDPLYDEARRTVIESKKASASLLQRRLRVGYARAARLIDMLEEKGVVGPGEGAKPREIIATTAEVGEIGNDDWQKV
ncbi:MAG: DNA translocase FtsK [Candidatus Nealsonbacteria bacterium]|nr:DNA translocase FtsK [Candidatus Nealsonbacteria bacterium]